LGPIRNRKTGHNFHQNQKPRGKIAQNRKTAENNDQNRKFVIFNPSILDTTAKYWPWGPFNALLYCLQRRFDVHYPEQKFFQCSTKAIASTIGQFLVRTE